MAECLVPNQVKPEHIQRFIVADHTVADSASGSPIILEYSEACCCGRRGK